MNAGKKESEANANVKKQYWILHIAMAVIIIAENIKIVEPVSPKTKQFVVLEDGEVTQCFSGKNIAEEFSEYLNS